MRAQFGAARAGLGGADCRSRRSKHVRWALSGGTQWYWKADFFKEISDEAIARHVEYGDQLPTSHSTMHLYPIDGAAGRVANDETAWDYRDAKWAQVMVGISPDPADNARMIAWAREYWEALHPHSAGGAYVNMMMDAREGGPGARLLRRQLRAPGGDQGASTTRTTSSASTRTSSRRSQPRNVAPRRAGIESPPVVPLGGPGNRRISPVRPGPTTHSRPRPRPGDPL